MPWRLVIFILCFIFHNLSEARLEKKHPSAVVVGTVYCDTCFQEDFSKASHFISGASVAVECRNASSRPSFREEVKTNEHGEFTVHLPFSISKHVKKIMGCSVKLIRSSEPYCAVASTATSSSLHLKSRKQGTHIFSAGFFTFKPLKQPELCNQKPGSQEHKQIHSPTPITKFDDPTFPPPIQDPPVPFLPPIDQNNFPNLPPLPTLPPLPQLPPLPPLPGLPFFSPSPIKKIPPKSTISTPQIPNQKVVRRRSKKRTPRKGTAPTPQFPDEKVAKDQFFSPLVPIGIPLPPNPFRLPSLFPPNPLLPPPSIFPPNPLLPPPSIFPPNPLLPPPSLIPPVFPSPPPSLLPPVIPSPSSSPPFFNLPTVPGIGPPLPPPPPALSFPLPPFPFQPSPGFPRVPPGAAFP